MKRTRTFALAAALTSPAFASNFSYTSIDASLGMVRLNESLAHAGEIYEEFGSFSFSGSLQMSNNLVLGLGLGVLANAGPDTEISSSTVIVRAAFPFAVSEYLDIVPTIGLLSFENEFCQYSWCYKDHESAAGYGIGLRLWALPSAVEIVAGISDSTLQHSQTVLSAGAGLWWMEHHSLRLNYSVRKESSRLGSEAYRMDQGGSEIALGYRFSW